jgi:radical SAM superfamily enzyme
MEQICQSCAMPIEDEDLKGTNKDGSKNEDYCTYCYQNGEFTSQVTMEEMVEICIPHTVDGGVYPDKETAREEMTAFFPQLKRWDR